MGAVAQGGPTGFGRGPPTASWRASLPTGLLFGVGLVLVILGVTRPEGGDRSALGDLPAWLVLVDLGVIFTASA
jgi:hypothetical protein